METHCFYVFYTIYRHVKQVWLIFNWFKIYISGKATALTFSPLSFVYMQIIYFYNDVKSTYTWSHVLSVFFSFEFCKFYFHLNYDTNKKINWLNSGLK